MNLSSLPIQRFYNNNNVPLSGGLLFTYIAGTNTKLATYTDSTGGTQNTNPIVLNYRGEAQIWIDPTLAYKFVLAPATDTDPPTNPFWSVDQLISGLTVATLTQQLIGQALYPRTSAEISAGITPTNFAYSVIPYDVRRVGAKFDGVTDDTAAITSALSVCSQSIGSGFGGQTLSVPNAIALTGSQITLPNNAKIQGQSQQGSVIQAKSGFSGSWMFNANNGSSSMFGSLLQDMTVDCNDQTGVGAILSDAWQENDGPRRCLIYRFRTFGIKYQNGFGGAAYSRVEDCSIYSSSSGATAGIRVEQISSVGNFMLHVTDTTINGTSSPLFILPKGIDIANDSSRLYQVHFEYCTSGIFLDGVGRHVIIGCSGGPSVTNLVEIASTFTGTLTMIGCLRAGATNFLKDNRVGGLGTISSIDIPNLFIGSGNGYTITNITQAASAVVTVNQVSASNPFAVGSLINFSGIVGMTQINGLQGTVSAIGGASGAWTATVNINSSGFTAYSSGGTATTPENRSLNAKNAAVAWCTFDGTKTGTNAPTAGFNVRSVTRNSAGNYSVNFENTLLASNSQCIAVTVQNVTAYSVNNQGPAGGFAQFIVEVLTVVAGNMTATPTDNAFVTFICFGASI